MTPPLAPQRPIEWPRSLLDDTDMTMDARAAVRRLLELQDDELDAEVLDNHLDDTAIELITDLCAYLSLAVTATRGRRTHHDHVRDQLAQCTAAINMVLEVWEMADVEIVGEPVFDEYAEGWAMTN